MLATSLYQTKIIHRHFHTTSPRHIPPVVWVFLKPALKGLAWLTGRSTRKWYRQLPPEKRSIFMQHLSRQKYKYIAIFGTIGTAFAIHYYTHLETVPITGRRRYMVLNTNKLQTFFDASRDSYATKYHHQLISEKSIETQTVARVARRILTANMDIPSVSTINWCVRVIDDNVKNAFVLPSGDIYIYRGWLEKIKNEDQLAVVLGHELAHAILGHSEEKMSSSRITDIFAILVAFVIWTVFPSDWTSFCTNYIYDKFIKFATVLPHSRRLEEEADRVGLMLIAKACYDVRESVHFWESMHETAGNAAGLEYTSTHPSNITRVAKFTEFLPWALDLRLQCKCSALPQYEAVDLPKISHDQMMLPFYKRGADTPRKSAPEVKQKNANR